MSTLRAPIIPMVLTSPSERDRLEQCVAPTGGIVACVNCACNITEDNFGKILSEVIIRHVIKSTSCDDGEDLEEEMIYEMTVFEALEVIFEVKRRSSYAAFDDQNDVICWNCVILLTQLYKFHTEFTKRSQELGLMKEIVAHNKPLMLHLEFLANGVWEDKRNVPKPSQLKVQKGNDSNKKENKSGEVDSDSGSSSKSVVSHVANSGDEDLSWKDSGSEDEVLSDPHSSDSYEEANWGAAKVYRCFDCSSEFRYHAQLREHSQLHKQKNVFCVKCNGGFRTDKDLKAHKKLCGVRIPQPQIPMQLSSSPADTAKSGVENISTIDKLSSSNEKKVRRRGTGRIMIPKNSYDEKGHPRSKGRIMIPKNSDDEEGHPRSKGRIMIPKKKIQLDLDEDNSTDDEKDQPRSSGIIIAPKKKIQLDLDEDNSTDDEKDQPRSSGIIIAPKKKIQLDLDGDNSTDDEKDHPRSSGRIIAPKKKIQWAEDSSTDDEKVHCCSRCNTGFRTRHNLKSHKCRPSQPKPKESTKYGAKRHELGSVLPKQKLVNPDPVKSQNKKEETKNVYCLRCIYCFATQEEFNKHERKCLANRVFLCLECGLGLTTEGRLKNHGLVHSKRNFVCTKCNAGFNGKTFYKAHRRRCVAKPKKVGEVGTSTQATEIPEPPEPKKQKIEIKPEAI